MTTIKNKKKIKYYWKYQVYCLRNYVCFKTKYKSYNFFDEFQRNIYYYQVINRQRRA